MSSKSIIVLALCLGVSVSVPQIHDRHSHHHHSDSSEAVSDPQSVVPSIGNSDPAMGQAPVVSQGPYDGQTTYNNPSADGVQVGGGRTLLSLIPTLVQAFLPPSVRQDLSELTESDAGILGNLVVQLPQYTSVVEVRQTLKNKSPRLAKIVHAKVKKVVKYFKARREALQPETQTFFDEVGHTARQHGNAYIILIERQSETTKQDLQSNFPILAHLIISPAGQTLINHLREAQ